MWDEPLGESTVTIWSHHDPFQDGYLEKIVDDSKLESHNQVEVQNGRLEYLRSGFGTIRVNTGILLY
jgi:hypothetical protein